MRKNRFVSRMMRVVSGMIEVLVVIFCQLQEDLFQFFITVFF